MEEQLPLSLAFDVNVFGYRALVSSSLFTIEIFKAPVGWRAELFYSSELAQKIALPTRTARKIYQEFEDFWEEKKLSRIVKYCVEEESLSTFDEIILESDFKYALEDAINNLWV